jgi:hypothetical protein
MKIMQEQPAQNLTASRIAEVSGITIGSFYKKTPISLRGDHVTKK